MRRNALRRRVLRKSAVELLEDRVMMSADPVAGLLGGAIDHHLVDDVSLEQPGAIDVSEQTPDFWLDETVTDLDQYLGEIEQTLAGANDMTGVTQVRADYGFVGTGQTVAVIDSGIAYDHYALGAGLGQNYRVVGGWDFTEYDADPYDDGPEGSHGTHVSGIIGADSGTSSSSGVAPGVDLVGLRVFNDAGSGYFAWVEQALQWVHQNRNAFENPITAVNLSLGTTWNSESIPSWTTLEDEFAQLEADGIFIAVSAGNDYTSYNTTGLSYPAASPYVVPVMSVDDSGLLSYYSQRSSRAIAAPGRSIYSTIPDYVGNHNGVTDDWINFSGTSMAAPYVAGASVIIREAMEFVGYTGITQQTIYDHMIATADQFYDSATDQYYDRINVGAAIDALIPADDFGSSVIDAYDLGTVSGTASLSGLIGKLDDVDYFTFTAGVNGTVSFDAAATHSLVADWTSVGGDAQLDGSTYTLDVVAGQTYTVGLSTTDGLGYYDLSITAESTFTYTDWGTVDQSRLDGISNEGESWYRMQAGHDGYLTAQALLAGATGDVDLFLYDHNLQPLVATAATGENDRVDALATAGDEFFLCVIGSADNVDFQLTNLVSVDGSTVNISGTDADDAFSFTAGGAFHAVAINGVSYQFDATEVTAVNFDGGAGEDSVTITGTAGNETATLRAGSATLVGTSFAASAADVEIITVYGGGGMDTANLYDSAADDQFRATQLTSIMSGGGYSNFASDFTNVYAYAVNGGNDTAKLYDSAGDDVFTAQPGSATLVGDGFYFYAGQFESVEARSTAGGNDQAVLYDSAGDDLLTARPKDVTLSGTGFQNTATGFVETTAYATAGGNDQANLYDGATDDIFVGRPEYAVLRSANGEFCNYAGGFDSVFAYATAGGSDRAYLYDGTTDDIFVGRPEYATLRSASGGFSNYASGFDTAFAYATAGGLDRAYLYDGATDDVFLAHAESAFLRSNDGTFYNYANAFDTVFAYATTGGNDQAHLYDGVGDDVLVTRPDSAFLRATDGQFYNFASGFDGVAAYATAGGNDRAYLYDGATDDIFVGRPEYAVLRSTDGQLFRYACGFDAALAYATAGGTDRAYLYDGAADDIFVARPDNGFLRSVDGTFYNYANGFDTVFAYATAGGDDRACFYDGETNDLFVSRPDSAFLRSTDGQFYNFAGGFEEVAAYSTAGGQDTAVLYDSAGDDVFCLYADRATMTGLRFNNTAAGFAKSYGYASTGADHAHFYDSVGDDTVTARDWGVSIVYGNSIYGEGRGFDEVAAYSLQGGHDHAVVAVDAFDYVFDQIGQWS